MNVCMKAGMKYIGRMVWFLIAGILLLGCSQEDLGDFPNEGNGELTLSMVADDLMPGELKTRAGSTRVVKDNEEMEINTLHVFIFGSDGEYVKAKEEHRYQGYTYLSGSTTLRIDKEGFSEPDEARGAFVCVVANVESGTFHLSGDNPQEIKNYQDFCEYCYQPKNKGLLFDLPDEGMPMVGIKEINLVDSKGSLDVELKALMARIDVNLSINNAQSTTDQPTILLKSITMRNMVQGARLTAETATDGTLAETDIDNVGGVQNIDSERSLGNPVIYNHQAGKSFTFYVFENIRGDNGSKEEEIYPQDENFKPEYKQRYKPLFAQKNATYAQFDCLFTSYNGLTYDVTYNLYFGGDNVKDFKIRRNHIYTNDVVIKGLSNVGESGEKVIFDARVNVSTTTNAYFVSCLRERQLDAHFNVFPMDVYVMEKGCHVKIEIKNPETIDWIRMEQIPAENMANGSVPSGLNGKAYAAGSAYTAGNGKRNYFTKDLLTSAEKLKNNTSYEMRHRDRVYFYVDEFLSTEEMRQATIVISLIDDASGDVIESYDVEFDQYGLLEVKVRSGDGGYPGDGATIYMERFEEYLNFSDPLEEYTTDFVYPGLPWGADGDYISSAYGAPAAENYYEGKKYTQAIIDAATDNPTLNLSPTTAAGYCWNKNKRSDENGNVNNDDYHWFLPAIRQLESCLTQYYYNYNEFQYNYYWSSAAAKKKDFGGDWGVLWGTWEETSRARATKVKSFIRNPEDGTIKAVYAESGNEEAGDDNPDNYTDEDGEGGRALRTESLRIRACYVGPLLDEP